VGKEPNPVADLALDLHVDVVVVFGCADITQVPNAVLRRQGNTVVVKCNYNGQTYLLTCSNNRWKGDLANCSKGRRHVSSSSALRLVDNNAHFDAFLADKFY